jgi:hypothetical protein
VAAQDQAISTNYFKRKILKEDIESRRQEKNMKKLLNIQQQDDTFWQIMNT